MQRPRTMCVFTHRQPAVVGDSVARLVAAAERHGLTLLASRDEADKHPGLAAAAEAADAIGWPAAAHGADLAIVLAGDGTLLRVLNQLRDGPPVLGVNFGILGYLSGTTADRLEEAVQALAEGRFATVGLSTLEATFADGSHCAVNDIVASGGVTGRIIELAWRIVSHRDDGSEKVDKMGIVPCDGMVVATPVGSTAYNLSNGGPILAWGVDGFAVSFIAPHTLSARPLVVEPGHMVELEHMGRGAVLKVMADGSQVGRLQHGERMRVGLAPRRARLALVGDKSFYARYRDNFAAQSNKFEPGQVVPEPEQPVVVAGEGAGQ